jgi:hypothetical protein
LTPDRPDGGDKILRWCLTNERGEGEKERLKTGKMKLKGMKTREYNEERDEFKEWQWGN